MPYGQPAWQMVFASPMQMGPSSFPRSTNRGEHLTRAIARIWIKRVSLRADAVQSHRRWQIEPTSPTQTPSHATLQQ